MNSAPVQDYTRRRSGHGLRWASSVALAVLAGLAVLATRICAAAPPHEPLDHFPHSPLTIESGPHRHRFEVWVADSAPRREQGLMFVRHLPLNKGMLFLFDPPQTVAMWMKNTYISLDMLFISEDGQITRIASHTHPLALDTISSLGPVTAVIELAGGACARLGIQPGDRVVK
jgi:uncharacterized membrane protein (UPF0127 family)